MKYDFNISKMEGKVQINTEKWLKSDHNLLELCRMNGKTSVTYITQAEFVGSNVSDVKRGDYILLSKVSCGVATSTGVSYSIEGNEKYFDVPEEQVLGLFKSNQITLDSLIMRNKNILFRRIHKKQNSTLLVEEKETMLGEITKTSKNSSLKVGNLIAVGDNVSTPLFIDGEKYYAIEEKFVIGIVTDDLSIENMTIRNNYILMKPYIPEHVLNSKVLITPNINYDDLDYSDINNRNLFRVEYVDKSLVNVKKGDILLLNRNYTNYMYYNNEKYFTINDKSWISGKIIERDKQCN